jgi:serine/threonine protein kinase
LDAGTIIIQGLVTASMMGGIDLRYRPDMSIAMGLSCGLIGRAAVVPSSAPRTALVGVLAGVPVLLATYVTYATAPYSARNLAAGIASSQIGMWLGFAVLLSTTISGVIYGLAKRVEEAVQLGQYTLERKIGEGGMGVVYLARHALLRRPTAIKLLAPGRASAHDLQRFEREVQTTSALRHPNTIAIYDYGRTPEGVFYYAMEYLDGIDLERLVRSEGPLPDARATRILVQVSRALDESHTAGLIHRDIKPSNILLCDHGHQPDFAKVLDFGLVKQLSDAGVSASIIETLTGTTLYLSPEAILSPAKVDARSDLYALGAVAYTLLTGSAPFSGATVVEVCGHHLHTPVLPPSQRRATPLSPRLEQVVLDCLAKDREQRPASAAALVEQLLACDVAPWSDQDARRWWKERGSVLRAARGAENANGASTGETVAIDLVARRNRTDPARDDKLALPNS